MARALEVAATARHRTSPNPWVGCVIVTSDGATFEGATEPPGYRHAERVAIDAAMSAGVDLRGATAVVTLEPCGHHGRTPPCTEAIIDAGIGRVVCALIDPDPQVGGTGVARLRDAGVVVDVGVGADEAEEQLRPYLHHRRTGRPYVVAKMACTIDGRTSAADGSSRWITGPEARRAVHRLRADCDAVVVGAATVRADDPSLTVRDAEGPDPRRVVLGTAPPDAKVHPCLEWHGDLPDLLDHLGDQGVLQLLVEGGANVVASFHRAHLVDRYVVHLAPALMGGDDGRPVLAGVGAPTIHDLWRGRIVTHRLLGDDLEIVVEPTTVSSGHSIPGPGSKVRPS
jgi:diaminohydroxyphosphoribosylaminopyrimidine deaminase / 5-amino-6-(5-phosphoribosylamino)uracil reductase